MKSDFINIYAGIGEKSQKEFKQYLYCFYGNQKQILATFEEVAAIVAIQDDKALLEFRQTKQVKKDDKSNINKKVKNDYVDLKKWLLEYLALQEIRSGSIEGKFLSLEGLRNQGLYDAAEQTSKQLSRLLEDEKSQNLWHLLWNMRLSYLSYFSMPIDRLQDYQDELLKVLDSLDNFYISAKLKFSAELYSRSNIRQELYDIILLEPIFDIVKSYKKLSPLVENLYLPMLELTKEHASRAYVTLKQFLFDKPHHDTFERAAILVYILNYTTSRLRKGDKTMIEESFELYQFGIDQSLFTITGYFLTNTFLNIVNTACQLGKTPWATNFVQQYADLLHPLEIESIKQLAMARIYFEDEKYPKAIDTLNKLGYNNFNFKLNVWTLKLRAYYELNELQETMLQANKSFYKFLMMNKEIGTPFKNSILGFITMYRLLVMHKSKKTQQSKKRLFKELTLISTSILCYDWIRMKIDELPD